VISPLGRSGLLVLPIVGLLLIAGPVGCERGGQSQADGRTATAAPPATPSLAESPVPGPPLPELTEGERDKALEIAFGDERVIAVLEGHAYTVEAVGVWTTPKSLRKVGAGIVLSFAQPISVDGDFPYVDYGGDEYGAAWDEYREGVAHVVSDSVTELQIMVDLARGQVVAINPY
jgi:hypothetical protein